MPACIALFVVVAIDVNCKWRIVLQLISGKHYLQVNLSAYNFVKDIIYPFITMLLRIVNSQPTK